MNRCSGEKAETGCLENSGVSTNKKIKHWQMSSKRVSPQLPCRLKGFDGSSDFQFIHISMIKEGAFILVYFEYYNLLILGWFKQWIPKCVKTPVVFLLAGSWGKREMPKSHFMLHAIITSPCHFGIHCLKFHTAARDVSKVPTQRVWRKFFLWGVANQLSLLSNVKCLLYW